MKRLILLLIVFLTVTFNCSAQELELPILMYHNINDEYENHNKNVEMSSQDFISQMTALKDYGYTTIFFEDYINYLTYGTELPPKPILVTFDDGYLNNYTVAYPILKQLGMKATIFIVTGRMGVDGVVTYPHFTWEQAKIMENSGVIDIQSHTNYHGELINLSKNDVILELRKSKYLIEKNLNKKVIALAYPYGFSNQVVRNEARIAGYSVCVEINDKVPKVNSSTTDPFKLCRITAHGGVSGEELIKIIEGAAYEN